MVSLDDIRVSLRSHTPVLSASPDRGRAAVAALLRNAGSSVDLLFIERASHDDDPWSGHIAFPGGKVDDSDSGPRAAAERECLEELGLDLSTAEHLGQLDDVTGHTLPVCVSGFVYAADSLASFDLNSEVKQAFWFPLNSLADPNRLQHRDYHYRDVSQTHPTVDLLGGPPYLWGITYRFVKQFLDLLGCTPGLQ